MVVVELQVVVVLLDLAEVVVAAVQVQMVNQLVVLVALVELF
jgi:hypothetical protein